MINYRSFGTQPALSEQRPTVATSTRRLARRIREEHDRRQIADGNAAWLPLDVLPWDAWVDRCWKRLRDLEPEWAPLRALSDEQERLVWEEEVQGSSATLGHLLMPREIARECQRAWDLVSEYRVSRDELIRSAGAETRQLLSIARRVEDRLRDEGWCGRSQRQAMIAAGARLGALALPHLALAGFDELTPAQTVLVDALGATGASIERLAAPAADSTARVLSCSDPESELQQVAMAARGWLEVMPEARIGVVVSDLELRREDVEQTFDDILTPGRLLPGALGTTRPWSVSLGSGLSDWPIVGAALRLLSLLFGDIVFTDISLLLRSPYVGGGAEMSSRGLLDAWLRERGVYRIDAPGLARMLGETADPRRPSCPELLSRLERLNRFREGLSRQASPDRWAVRFAEVLSILGWPGDRPLDSAEFQCLQKWHETLSELATTGQVTGSLDGASCLDRLARLAAETTFQPESPDPPVQVIGLLETPGLVFDAVWVTGMHHLAWPRPVRPNPLIPASVQRRHRMPRSCPEVELDFCRARMSALSASAGEVVFSWPAQIDDEQLRPSPLLAGLVKTEETEEAWRSLARRELGSAHTERMVDARLRPLERGSRVRGGSAVVRWQSACPFQAQARSRLDCRSLEQPVPGVRAIDSGSIAHLALQWLWEDWGDSTVPASMDRVELTAAVEGTVDRATRRILIGQGDFARALLDLERRRVSTRILALLEQDMAREPFTVTAIERQSTPEIEGVVFGLRIDRIDRLTDDVLLLIDYKTGKVSVSDWHGERPREPQLPLYLLSTTGAEIRGVAFGCLRVGEEGYRGYAEADVAGTGIKGIASLGKPPEDAASWEALTAEWTRRLTSLVREFVSGEARVEPRSVAQDCRYCDLSPLCRRHELALSETVDDA